ncbi:MAG: CoA ester lyase [Reyranella sp.]|nr:MAG: CoA ester lyase [Reyranella sp.]
MSNALRQARQEVVFVFPRARELRKVRLQRSELAVPASSEKFFEKAAKGPADGIFLDLEDAVVPELKEKARELAVAALNEIDWGDKIMAVRINSLDTKWAYRDIIAVAERCPRLDLILLPKTNMAADVYVVEQLLDGIESTIGRKKPIGIEVLIETAAGLANVEEIAQASDRLEAMIFGVGDFTISMRARDPFTGESNPRYRMYGRNEKGERELHWNDPWHFALARIATACRAFGLRPLDGPYADFKNPEGFRSSAERASALGFEGKWAIHPSQVEIANEVFAPDPKELVWAKIIKEAMTASGGNGAIQLDGKLVDLAHIKLADALLERQALVDARKR